MKTFDEVKLALRCCATGGLCLECPYYDEEDYDGCTGEMAKDALAHLEAMYPDLKDECTNCKHNRDYDGVCFGCTMKNNHWEWRGVQSENKD